MRIGCMAIFVNPLILKAMMTNFSLLFYLKKPKNYLEGPVPVYLRITVNGKPAEISTGRECEPGSWNSRSGRINGTREAAKTLNTYLDVLQTKVYDAHRSLIEAGVEITAQGIKNKLTGKRERFRSLFAVFEDHNRQVAALVGKEYTKGTLQRYEITLRHLRDFVQWKYRTSDMDVRSVNHEFISSFDFYLRSVRNCGNNSAVKYIKNFGKIVRICLANGWLSVNPFLNYKARLKKVTRVFLDTSELDIMAGKEFEIKRLAEVRDVFLFCCYTGLAYVDVKKLSRAEIRTGLDGDRWIFTKRTKTDTPSSIPLLPAAIKILEKYKDHPECSNSSKLLPVISNQKMNAYLKEIAHVCGIQKPLTFHIARHTFATTVTLLNGVPIESVSRMLGHTNIKTTQHYAKILDMKVSEDMRQLKQKFAG